MPKGRKGLYPGFRTVRKRLPCDFTDGLVVFSMAVCDKDKDGAITLVEKMLDS